MPIRFEDIIIDLTDKPNYKIKIKDPNTGAVIRTITASSHDRIIEIIDQLLFS
jgi:hypothetical protein